MDLLIDKRVVDRFFSVRSIPQKLILCLLATPAFSYQSKWLKDHVHCQQYTNQMAGLNGIMQPV